MSLFSSDHKAVARGYLWGGLGFLLLGGLLALIIRWQWAFRGSRCRGWPGRSPSPRAR
ncbi:hypothetical protein ACLESD_42340 [Pyxidicoccus sp. 3LFB2]